MIRVKQCCCGCTLDIGARIFIWADLIATFMIGLSVASSTIKGSQYNNDYIWYPTAFIIPVKFIILIAAVMGVNKKKASYLQPYIIFNVLAIITMGVLVVVAILQFNTIVDSDIMKSLMGNWETAMNQYRREHHRLQHDFESEVDQGRPTEDENLDLQFQEAEHIARVSYLILAIIGGVFNFFAWTYFNIVVYSYYKTLREGGNFTNVDGVEYFAPTEQISGKSVPQGASLPSNIPPSYFAATPYPTQPYSQAPPPYDEAAAGPNAYANPSFPQTKQ